MLYVAVALIGLIVLAVRWRRSGLPLLPFVGCELNRVYVPLWQRGRVTFRGGRIPELGPVLVVANHTCSADPPFIHLGSPRILSFVVAREHYNFHWLIGGILGQMRCVPVTRGGHDAGAARRCLRRLEAGLPLVIFPEGGLSGNDRNRRIHPKHGAAWLALKSGVPVLPVFIAGGPRTSNLLVAWFWPARRPVKVTYGPFVDLTPYRGRALTRTMLEEVSQLLMDRVYALDAPTKRN